MSTYVDSDSRVESRRPLPAYGPVDAVLGFVVFYVFVDRATPTVVSVFTDAVPGLSPSFVRLGLALALWFVLAVTVLEQVRRQLAALGVGTHESVTREAHSRIAPSEMQTVLYLGTALVGGVVAAWTFDRAVAFGVAMIRIVAELDVEALLTTEFVVLVVFFVSFELATHSLDRLLVGGLRAYVADVRGDVAADVPRGS